MSNNSNNVSLTKTSFTQIGIRIEERRMETDKVTIFGGFSLSHKETGERLNGWLIWASNQQLPVVGVKKDASKVWAISEGQAIRQMIRACCEQWKGVVGSLKGGIWYNLELVNCQILVVPMGPERIEHIEHLKAIKVAGRQVLDCNKLGQ